VSGLHWAAYHVAWLRSIIPELGSEPVYIRRADEMPAWMRESGVVAWSSVMNDLQMRDVLTERGEWQGRGNFIGVNPSWDALPFPEQRAILLHEIAHGLCNYDALMRRDESEFDELELTLLQPGGVQTLAERYDLTLVSESKVSKFSHGLRFVRCGIHLAARCWDEISLRDMHIFGESYALDIDSAQAAVRELMPEVRRGGHIIEILKTEPPEAFSALFE
jgi:hypothetical protein